MVLLPVQLRFERGTVATPELKQDVELPSSISLLGQPVDLSSLKASVPWIHRFHLRCRTKCRVTQLLRAEWHKKMSAIWLDNTPSFGSGQVQEALLPAQSAAQDAIQRLAQIVSQQPDLQFPISSDNQLWFIITYVDEACAPATASDWAPQTSPAMLARETVEDAITEVLSSRSPQDGTTVPSCGAVRVCDPHPLMRA